MSRTRVGVLFSGRGSNMAALLDAARDPAYPAEFVLALSNNPDAPGLELARAAGVPAKTIDHRGRAKAEHEAEMTAALQAADVELVALAGFMRVLSPAFVEAWRGRILNIHPSLLPRHPGLDTHRRALEAGDPEAGCSVHLVTEGVDEGPVLAQARVPVLPIDTEYSLAARVLEAEHRLYPAALADYVRRGRWRA